MNPYRILLCFLRGSLYIITRKSDPCLFPCFLFLDYDVADKIYDPYDNLGLSVILHGDGTREYKVVGAFAEAVKAQSSNAAQWKRLKEIFTSKSLQMDHKSCLLHHNQGTGSMEKGGNRSSGL